MPPWRILVVDDEPDIGEVLAEYLRGLGHHVESLTSGREAVELMQTGPAFDLAVVDWHMPGLNGRDVVNDIARNNPSTRVVVTTGDPSERVGRSQLSGVTAKICRKPFSLRTLKSEIETLMETPIPGAETRG